MADSVQTPTQTSQEEFHRLRQDYEQRLPHKVHLMVQLGRSLHDQWSREKLLHLRLLSHRLRGSSATFGFTQISQIAHRLEEQIDECLRSDVASIELRSRLQDELRQLTERLADRQVESTSLSPLITPALEAIALHRPKRDPHLVFLVEDDLDLSHYLISNINHFGYQVCHLNNLAELQSAMEQTTPAAIIMDIVLPEGELAGTEAIAALQQGREQPLPVLFISARDDLMARLQAVRAGGSAYFTKPIDMGELVAQLDLLTAHDHREPYRVLIVEDDANLATEYALILQQAGILTRTVIDPLQVMPALVDFNPDLILMDLYLPDCSGTELAAILRQHGAYVSIPIIFISSEDNVERQLTTLQMGGDLFLSKPIQPNHLIASVLPRLQRSSVVRSLIERDGLTGLLNHTKVKEQLVVEVQRASRQDSSLVFAMIDIDRFKLVNDTYGHLAGDRVLKNLSRLLQQRLRRADIIGRYGGEEFAIILPDTDAAAAFQVINEIRQGFAQMPQQTDHHQFTVTFSCGIASFPPWLDANSLSQAADRALYQAKRQGRDRIVMAHQPIG